MVFRRLVLEEGAQMDAGRLREVHLPREVSGRLFLCEMLGRYGPLEGYERELAEAGVHRVVCLAPVEEVRGMSPDYARKLEQGEFPVPVDPFPIPDHGIPRDPEALLELAGQLAARLRDGQRVLVHCAAGIGRTGTVAVCVLAALGLPPDDAWRKVQQAGSSPEPGPQEALVRKLAARAGSQGGSSRPPPSG